MLATALWDCYLGMGGDSQYESVKLKAADAMIRTMMEMLLIVPDSSTNDLTHTVSMAQGCITADIALTGGLYAKVMDDAFIDRGLWNLRQTDVYIHDSSADTGNLPSPIPHWTSPDIWVRNKHTGVGENPADGHQEPITNQLNYLYVKVRNRGTAAAAANTLTLEAFHCDPGTGMTSSRRTSRRWARSRSPSRSLPAARSRSDRSPGPRRCSTTNAFSPS